LHPCDYVFKLLVILQRCNNLECFPTWKKLNLIKYHHISRKVSFNWRLETIGSAKYHHWINCYIIIVAQPLFTTCLLLRSQSSSFHLVGMLSTYSIRCTFHLLQTKTYPSFLFMNRSSRPLGFKDYTFFTILHYGVLGFSK
jgi:hypothetical protein